MLLPEWPVSQTRQQPYGSTEPCAKNDPKTGMIASSI